MVFFGEKEPLPPHDTLITPYYRKRLSLQFFREQEKWQFPCSAAGSRSDFHVVIHLDDDADDDDSCGRRYGPLLSREPATQQAPVAQPAINCKT